MEPVRAALTTSGLFFSPQNDESAGAMFLLLNVYPEGAKELFKAVDQLLPYQGSCLV
ncbi:hypothetical protein [Mucilaginibacter sp. L3T2-6]|uniref:hypothetical protein n=1 Tax=Mucilaginibacter sp. L3T2-6 TaxID=3062491 RepID=UPI00267711B4|nr:hypothetical protein [Mucilaginibacter sp. L3T2-6]MDO3641755.1 hypothetical protein [Mucilaginibacter sp. L3T2-6]MDV6214249.1 hypothetical protein [Mucilaginibacter sp. L3T2-6]